MKTPTLVIVEQDAETRDILLLAFESRGYVTWTCAGMDIAITLFLTAQPDVVLIDVDENLDHGLNVVQTWKKAAPHTQLIVQSFSTDENHRRAAMDHGAYAYLMKPVTPEVLFEALRTYAEPAEPQQVA